MQILFMSTGLIFTSYTLCVQAADSPVTLRGCIRCADSCLSSLVTNIQLMHSFEVDIRICQPENSDVHRGEAEVNITFEG